MKEVISY